ncbi:WxL domain-containing protein [Lactococcus petauri]|uniref:WxL domain-containing protein n=1 Tax=Lactococcus petauri TaxID=1940789 RepID=UPI001781CB00|nr:WxL domain-containing protein [Lactococcus petauri]MBD5824507.1 WxL domain-containing protein [Lactococcus petauri]
MKKSTKLGIIVACSAALFSLNSSLFNSEKVEAATSISGTLVPGETVDTGNHALDSSFQQNKNNWSVLSGSTSWWLMQEDNYFRLANSQTGSWTYHVMNATIDFSKPVSISVPYSYDTTTVANVYTWGDASGFFLSPEDKATIQKNGPSATGKYLGIQGLPNSYFVGRDPWNNKGFDTSKSEGRSDNILIRQTDAQGEIETSNSTTPGWAQQSAALRLSYGKGGETQTLTWTNINDNGNGTYTGTLSLTSLDSNPLSTLGPITIQRTVTMRHQMTFGSVGITGANTGIIREGNATSAASFSATKGTSSVKINYIDNSTNTLIKQAPASSIIANTGDTIGVTNGTLNSLDTYDYTAPKISNYTFLKGGSTTVESSDTNAATTNEINVYYDYTPKSETATLQIYYSKGTPGTGEVTDALTGLVGGSPESTISKVEGLAPALPDSITTTGDYGSPLKDFLGDSGIPLGYEMDYVVGPDGKNGKIYPDLKTAMAANPNYEDIETNAWANYFSVYLKAKKSTAKFTYKYIEGTRPNAPTLPDPFVQTGVTGGIIVDPTEALPSLPKGSIVQDIIGPDGKRYSTLLEAIIAEENKNFDIITKNFTLTIVAPPVSVTLNDVPELDFGTQELKGKPVYSTSPQGVLGVSDDTATNKGWSITANLIQQFTTASGQSIKGATLLFDKGEVTPAVGNTSTPPTASEFMLSENGPVRVANAQANTGQGNWQLKFPNVSLNTHGSALEVNQQYQATIEWDISNVPE